MITPLVIDSNWRDHWGQFGPPAAAQMMPLELAGCYRPRLVLLPDNGHQVVPASGKIEYAFSLKPGSLVWGMFIKQGESATFQLTDVNLEHKFFQEPVVGGLLLDTLLASAMVLNDFPSYLPLACPHPVIGDGLFMFEAWQSIGVRVSMLLGVAEVYECQQ